MQVCAAGADMSYQLGTQAYSICDTVKNQPVCLWLEVLYSAYCNNLCPLQTEQLATKIHTRLMSTWNSTLAISVFFAFI